MARMKPVFFDSPDAFRAWLRTNHKKSDELIVAFHKKNTGKPSMTWPESVAEALCYGWIDSVRRRVDDDAYTIRFTPRRKGSKWSAVNVKMVAELEAAGKMRKAGRDVFHARPDPSGGGYSYERENARLDATRVARLKKHKAAWAFFESRPPGYRRLMAHWVMSAMKDETRDRRLARLIEASAAGKRIF